MKIYEIAIPLLSNTKVLVTQAFLYLLTLLYVSYYIIVSQQPVWWCLLLSNTQLKTEKFSQPESYLEDYAKWNIQIQP